jgi:hypothetical protein
VTALVFLHLLSTTSSLFLVLNVDLGWISGIDGLVACLIEIESLENLLRYTVSPPSIFRNAQAVMDVCDYYGFACNLSEEKQL